MAWGQAKREMELSARFFENVAIGVLKKCSSEGPQMTMAVDLESQTLTYALHSPPAMPSDQ